MATETFDRHTRIIDALREQRRISTRALSQRFDVSEVTIRKDLAALEKQGWLQRVHGGAEALRTPQPEQSFAERRHLHAREKERLAEAAAHLVQPGQTLILDNSTSAYQLALQLCQTSDLRIVTNSFPAASAVAGCRNIEVVVLGGVLRPETSSIVGPFLGQMLDHLHADWLFLGASGVSVARGLTDADIREVEAKRAMVHAARQVVALVDGSKFHAESFLTFATLGEVDILISDEQPPEDIAIACVREQVQVRVV
jgi:DeoR family fructose operon transcriptional repressor